MSCSFPDSFQIATNVFYSAFTASLADALQCAETYLRPDPGGSLLPWLWAFFLLLLHFPACVIRASRWESAQYLALSLAVLNLAITLQAYLSTKLKPEEVLVWMPLTLLLDIGAMMQLVVLILERHGIKPLQLAVKDALRTAKKTIVVFFWNLLLEREDKMTRDQAPIGTKLLLLFVSFEANSVQTGTNKKPAQLVQPWTTDP